MKRVFAILMSLVLAAALACPALAASDVITTARHGIAVVAVGVQVGDQWQEAGWGSGFFVGKIIDAAIVGVILFVAMSVLGISFTPLIAVLMGVCNIIPVFGPFIGAVPSLIILLIVNPLQALEFLILVVVVQQVDGNVIAPKVLGRSLGISAFWVLFAATSILWGNVLAFLIRRVFSALFR